MLCLDWPRTILPAFILQDVEGILHARIVANTGRLEIVECAQYVVFPTGWIGEHKHLSIDYFSSPVGFEQPVL